MKIISGSQTGADIAGLKVAKKYGFETGGFIPKGFVTLDGPKPLYANLYNIQETKTNDYPTRTGLNVKHSDCTIWLDATTLPPKDGEDRFSRGKLCTFKFIKLHKKPFKDININNLPNVEKLAKWIVYNNFNIINIAGNSENKYNNMEEKVSKYLNKLFKELQKYDSDISDSNTSNSDTNDSE